MRIDRKMERNRDNKQQQYIFFCNKFKYQGYIITKDEIHLTIFDTYKNKQFLLPTKETIIEVFNPVEVFNDKWTNT